MNHKELPADDTPPTDQPAINVDIDTIIVSLHEQHTSLSQHIDHHWHDLDANHLARFLALHGQNATRLGRLLRDRCAIHGKPEDPMDTDIRIVLNVLSEIKGIDLLNPEDRIILAQGDPKQPPIDIQLLITNLHDKQARFSHYIESHRHDLDATSLARLFTVYGQNATRLGRLLRDRHAIYGEPFDQPDDISPATEEWIANLLGTE
ncbi:MAG: hypothetical protein IMY75_03635 [Chloroflexi bacterium]|nr:hypothetical protein [Chloroflexota bacterium]